MTNKAKFSFDTLYTLCNKHQWFTHGTSYQYDRLFSRARQGATIGELTTIIWLCSAPEFTREDIYEELAKAAEEEWHE